jgi:hypothetical protein
MATRFRKHSTRKVRRSKSLKTRKHRGAGLMNMFRKKDSSGDMMGSAGNAHAFLGIKKKGIFNKMKNFFTRKEKQDGGAGPISIPSFSGLFGMKSPLSSSPSPSTSPKPNITKKNKTFGHTTMTGESHADFLNRKRKEGQKGGDIARFLSKSKNYLKTLRPQYMKNTETFMTYLKTLDDEVQHKLTHEQRMKNRDELLQQLRQDKLILTEMRSKLGESRFGNILQKIEKIQNFIERNTNNNNNS